MLFLGARGTPGDPEARLAAARDLGNVQLLDARLVVGRDHLVSAHEHAERAMRAGTNVADSLAVEFLLYASGERRISEAIRKMGVRGDTETFAVVLFDREEEGSVLRDLGMTRDDGVLAATPEKVRAFGITEAEAGSVAPDRIPDLVLERVALVDLRK